MTDLDLADKGDRAVAVVRSTSQVAVLPIPGILAAPTVFTTVTITGETVGSVAADLAHHERGRRRGGERYRAPLRHRRLARVAFWSLGRATGQPYRSVEVVGLSSAIGSVLDVPPPRPELKVLQGSGNAFYVLNLATRTASPLTTLGAASLVVSRDGTRLWAFQRGTSSLAEVSLADLHPIPLPLDRPIDSVFDVARPEGGRSLITIDVRGAGGATVLDALTPDTAASRSFYGFLLEDL